MKQLTPLIAVLALSSVQYAMADQDRGFFIGANIAGVNNDNYIPLGAKDDKARPLAIEFVGGYRYNGLLSFDLRYASGVKDDKIDTSVTGGALSTAEFQVDSYHTFYYRPEFTNESAKLYGLIGYSLLEYSGEIVGGVDAGKVEYSEEGVSYGIGAGWYYGGDMTVNIEYRILSDKDSMRFNVATFGIDYRF